MYEARRNKGMTLVQAAEAAKQLIIRVRRREISALILGRVKINANFTVYNDENENIKYTNMQ